MSIVYDARLGRRRWNGCVGGDIKPMMIAYKPSPMRWQNKRGNDMSVTTELAGARVYVVGNSYPIKDRLKSAGCHWDADRKQWWIGAAKHAAISDIIADVATGSGQRPAEDLSGKAVYAKAKYKGRTYFVIGRSEGKEKYWLTVLDASINFWAAMNQCEIVKTYSPRKNGYGRYAREEYQTLGGIRRFAERSRSDEKTLAIGEIPPGYCVDLEDGFVKRRSDCDMPSD